MSLGRFIQLTAIILIFLTAGCSSEKPAKVKLITNSWIGYTPLFYAKEKGWLEELNIELSTVVSLGESMMTYHTGHFDGLTGTQYELNKLNEKYGNLIPVIMFDRSNGGDMVMSNRSITELKNTTERIEVLLEINSINSLVFKDFVRANALSEKDFHYINKDQLKIVTSIKNESPTSPTITVTYVPYNHQLEDYQFKTIASTKDIKDIVVLDALYVNKDRFSKNRNVFLQLKEKINLALEALKQDPKAFYETVKPYLGNPDYDEFQSGLNDIEWIDTPLKPELVDKMETINFPAKDLI